MAFMCRKGHMHGTQMLADNCYICKRRAQKKSAKRVRAEQNEEIAALLRDRSKTTNIDQGERDD